MQQAKLQHEATGQAARIFSTFEYRTQKSWSRSRRVIAKAQNEAPHETLLVLDANTGQNALAQAAAFDAALGLTGLVLTKLDGSAKGGVVAAIAGTHPVPVRFIGVGEGIEDLQPFVVAEFVEALLG